MTSLSFNVFSLLFIATHGVRSQVNNYVTMKNLGCWRDGFSKVIPPLEGRSSVLDGNYNTREDAVQKCARAAMQKGYRVFVLQNGGWCGSSETAISKYSRLGRSQSCRKDGEGGFRANQVYLIVGKMHRGAVASSRSIVRPNYVFEGGRHVGRDESVVKEEEEGAHEFILNDLGCWPLPSSGIQNMEGLLDELDGNYRRRSKAVTKCAKGLADLGFKMMAMHDGGKCLSVDDVEAIVGSNPSRRRACSFTGKGTRSSVQIYEIRYSKTRFPPPPLPTRSTTTTSTTRAPTTTPRATQPLPPRVVQPIYVEVTQPVPWWSPRLPVTQKPVITRRITQATMTRPRSNYKEYIHITDLGCWAYVWNDTIPSLEGNSPYLDGHYSQRTDTIRKCAKAASSFGYEVFAIQDGGRCASSRNAREKFSSVGTSTYCREDGKGGSWVNQVYEVNVVWDVKINGLGCFATGLDNPLQTLEGTSEILDGEYFGRENAIRKCARLVARRGFEIFGMHDDGECMVDTDTRSQYSNNGESNSCPRHGRGGFEANEVYEIILATKIKIRSLGCWKDSRSRAVPGMERTDGDLMLNYKLREDAIGKCARAAYKNGFKVFVLQDGGWCGGSASALATYARYGISTACRPDGEGGFEANQVYQILNG